MKTTTITLTLIATLVVNVSILTAQNLPANIKEYGIGFRNLNDFSLQYRFGTEKKLKRIDLNLGGSTSFANSSDRNKNQVSSGNEQEANGAGNSKTPVSFNLGLVYSRLKLKAINDKFGLLSGTYLGIYYNTKYDQSVSENKVQNINNPINPTIEKRFMSTRIHGVQTSFGMVLGAYYKINQQFLIYAEVAPGVYYNFSHIKLNTETKIENVGISNSSFKTESEGNNHSFGITGFSNSAVHFSLIYRITK
jgi:hypothetical protein